MSRLALLLLLLLAAPVWAAPLTLADGDRVVLLGNTLIEREQRYGYWETALTRRFPGKKIVVRNLGWSGDTVFGDARAGFGSQAHGFQQLRQHVLALKPTVIVLAYGTNESFDGPAGLKRFTDGCNALLAALAPTKARITWLSPMRQEEMPAPLPDPGEHNRNLQLYSEAIHELARKNNHTFVDLFSLLGPEGAFRHQGLLTDNGIHLTAHGYRHSAFALEKGLGLTAEAWDVKLTEAGEVVHSSGCRVKRLDDKGLRFEVTDDVLPMPPEPAPAGPLRRHVLHIAGLAPGKHTLTIDAKPVATHDAEGAWSRGVALYQGPEFDQAEQLRQTIIAKNRLYFHRWRPQNETYLFGFRKHEQGQNAREIPLFDPLVEKEEEAIHKLSSPRPHVYEIKPEAKQ